ncbi:MAG: cytochrome c-type biogenesis protein CcmH [Gammaproteobacteria bacterium]|nr:cytochrome c-type biogenesis protein CcmH [Gammaproteobacteria bacterium]
MTLASRFCLLGLLWLAGTAYAQEVLQFDSDAQRQAYRQLTGELRCPQCQNQNIADSNAIVAVDMRQKTYELVRQGQNKQQVLDYMINRYGDFVHYQPPVNRYTIWLWLMPLLLLVLLLALGLYRRASQQAKQQRDNALPAEDATVTATEVELDHLIARYRSKKP